MAGKTQVVDRKTYLSGQVGYKKLAEKKDALFAIAREMAGLLHERRENRADVKRCKAAYQRKVESEKKRLYDKYYDDHGIDPEAFHETAWRLLDEAKANATAEKDAIKDAEAAVKATKKAIKEKEKEHETAKKGLIKLLDQEVKHLKKQRKTILKELKDPEGMTVKDRLEWLVAARDRQYRGLQDVLAEGAARYPLTSARLTRSRQQVEALKVRIGDPANVGGIALEDVSPDLERERVRERVLEDLMLLEKKVALQMWSVRELDARAAAYEDFKEAIRNTKSFWKYVGRMQDWHSTFLGLAESITTVTRLWKKITGGQVTKHKTLTGARDFAIELGVGASVGAGDAVKLAEMGLSILVSGKLSHDDDRRLRATLSLQLKPSLKLEVSGCGVHLFDLTASFGITLLNQTYAFVDAKHFAYYLSFRVANLVHFTSKFSQYSHGHRAMLHQHIDVYSSWCRELLAEMMDQQAIDEMRTYLSKKPIVKAHRKLLGMPDVDLGFSSTFVGEAGASGSWQRTTFQRQRLELDDAAGAGPRAASNPVNTGDFWKYESSNQADSLYHSMSFLLHSSSQKRMRSAWLRGKAKGEWTARHNALVDRQREKARREDVYDQNKRQILLYKTENAVNTKRAQELKAGLQNLQRVQQHGGAQSTSQRQRQAEIEQIGAKVKRREGEIAELEKENEEIAASLSSQDEPGDDHWALHDGETLTSFQREIDAKQPADDRHLAALAYHYNLIVKLHTTGRKGTRTIGPAVEDILRARRKVKTIHLLREQGNGGAAWYHALVPNQGGAAPNRSGRIHTRTSPVAYQSTAYDVSVQTTREGQLAEHAPEHRLVTEVRHGTTRSLSGSLNVTSWVKVGVNAGYTYIGVNANPDNDGHYLTVQVDGGIFTRTLSFDFDTAFKEARKEALAGQVSLTADERAELGDLTEALQSPYAGTSAEEAHDNYEEWGKGATPALKEEAGKLAKSLFGSLPDKIAEVMADAGAAGLDDISIELGRTRRYLTFNIVHAGPRKRDWRLQYLRWEYSSSSKIGASGTIPTGHGIDPKISGSLSWSKTVALQERLGANTLTYVITVLNGLKRRPNGYEQWMDFLEQNSARLRVLMLNVATQQDNAGGVRAEVREMEQQVNEHAELWQRSKWAALERQWMIDSEPHPMNFVAACVAKRPQLERRRSRLKRLNDLRREIWGSSPRQNLPPALVKKFTALLWRASQVAEWEHDTQYPWKRKTVYLAPPKGRISFGIMFDEAEQRFVASRMPRVDGDLESVTELLKASRSNQAYFRTTIVDVLRNSALFEARSILPFYQNGFEIQLEIQLPHDETATLRTRQPIGDRALRKAVLELAARTRERTLKAQKKLLLKKDTRRERAANREKAFFTLLRLHPALSQTRGQWKLGDKKMKKDEWKQHARQTWDNWGQNAPQDWFEEVLESVQGPFWGLKAT